MIYILCFAVSAGFAILANRTKNRFLFFVLSLLSISVVVALAGFRDYTIGTDTYNYLEKKMYWGGAVSAESIWEYFRFYFPLGYGEPLFAVLLGVIAQLTGNFTIFLIICHTIILVCVYIGIFRFKEYVNPAFVLLLYYLLYYNHTLNMIRQHMAMAIVFVGLADIIRKKYIRFCFFVFIAFLFHTTAIIALGLLMVYGVINIKFGKLKKIGAKPRICFTVFSLSGVVFLFAPIINFLVDFGILNKRYLYFLRNNVDPALIASIVVLLGLLGVLIFRKAIKEKCEDANFFILVSMCYLILMQLSLTVAYGKRIALHFAMSDLITLGLVESSPKSSKKRLFVRMVAIAICLIYWIYIYAFRNAGKTFPYILVM